MAFDIGEVLEGMVEAASGVLSKEGPKIRGCIKQAFEEEREALAAIAEARLKGEIDDEDFESQLEDEKDALKAALLACKVKAKAAVQKAANAATQVFADAIKALL